MRETTTYVLQARDLHASGVLVAERRPKLAWVRFSFGRLRLVASLLTLASAAALLQAGQRGDGDRDRDIDLADIASFQLCFENTSKPPVGVDCLAYDFNGDGAVDLADARLLTGSMLGPDVIPPTITDTAVILGKVFHAGTDDAFSGVTITAVFAPAAEGGPDLPPIAITDANGEFRYETVPFEGKAEFLVRIRKGGFAEALRRVEVMAGRCWRIDDAHLNPVTPPVMVTVKDGAMLTEPTGQVTLEIPPGALQQDSEIGVTVLTSHEAIRDDLPQLVGTAGTFIDISGVFGDETTVPVTLCVPNQYDLPLGTELRFGKIDHNTLEWMDLETEPGVGVGVVKPDGNGGTLIEVKFDHFCTVCTGYCLSARPGDGSDGSRPGGGEGGGKGGPGNTCGNSVINQREGYLWETVSLPSFQEIGQSWGLSFAYFSSAANPSASLSATIDYGSTRPVERTIFEFDIEGVTVEATYDFSENNQKHHGTFIWDGRNGLGSLMPTGSYTYRMESTSLNADAPVALSSIFGGTPTRVLSGVTYPGLTPLSSDPIEGRVVLVNLTDSPYGTGWSLTNEHRLYFDPDGCVVVLSGNADWKLFVPADPDTFIAPAGDFSSLERQPNGTYIRSFNDGTSHFFTAAGRIDRIVDRYGYTTSYAYQGGLLTRVTSPTGYFFDLAYSGGKLSQIIDSTGRVTNISIDMNGDLVSATLPDSAARTFEYDAEHLLVAQNGGRGERSEYDYQTGRIVENRAFDVDGTTLLRRRQFSPSVLNGEMSSALQAGFGSLVNPIPVVEDRVDRYVDGRGQTWLNETDGRGNTIRSEDPLSRATTRAFDGNNLRTSRTRPNGSITEFEYDAFGNRIVLHELFNGAITLVEYLGPFRSASKVTDPRGNETSFAYLPNGSLSQITDALSNTTSFLYEEPSFPNLVTTIRDALNNNTTLSYDERGNLVSLTNPLNRSTSFEYDGRGNRAAVIDGRGERTEMVYDANNRLTLIRDALLQTTELQYDETTCGCKTNDITRVVFPNLADMRFRYDGLGRQIGETDQLGKQKSFTYDAEGNRTALVNRNGERIDFMYDAASQLVRKELPGNDATTYAYDALGNLSFAENSTSRLTVEYDGLGRLRETTQTLASVQGFVPAASGSETFVYEYDLTGNRTGMTTSFGDVVYAYDELDRLTTLTNPFLETWTFLYNALGALTELQLPNTLVTRATYDQGLELSEISLQTAAGVPFMNLSYPEYDGAGNSTTQLATTSSGTSESVYAYDELSRLVSSTVDPTPAADSVSIASTFDEANRLQLDNEFTYAHDAEGRLLSKRDPTQSLIHSYQYNAEGQLLQYAESLDQDPPFSVLKAQYLYDPLGRRVSKNVEGVASTFFYDGSNRLSDMEGGGVVSTFYTSGLGIDESLSRTNTGIMETLYYHQDRLGSVVALTDALGVVVQEYQYDAFGTLLAEADPSLVQPYAFTSRVRDRESNLYYYRNRYYDSDLGRFISEDPIGLLGGDFNFFNYAGQDPVNRSDPFGLSLIGLDPNAIPLWQLKLLLKCATGSLGGGLAGCTRGVGKGVIKMAVKYGIKEAIRRILRKIKGLPSKEDPVYSEENIRQILEEFPVIEEPPTTTQGCEHD